MGGGGGGGGGDDRQQDEDKRRAEEQERAQREAEQRDRERREREQRQRESDDADKRRAEEQARAQREAEERQRQQRERERAEEARRAAKERNEQFGVTPRQVSTTPPPADAPDADKQRAAEIEAAQRQAEGRAIDERQRLKAEPTSTSLEGFEQRQREALERAEFVSGDESFVRGGTERGIVTGGRDGKPVLTRQGVERKAAFEQEELERLVSLREGGEGDPEEGKRNLAKQIIEEKLAADPTLPPGLKAIREINLRNQLKNLEAGGTPTFRIGEGGQFTTSGVLQPGEEGTGIAPNITSDLETMMDEREQEEQPTILQAEPEPEPEVAATGTLGVAAAPRGRRGTRAKRPGAGGTLLEGGGVLYD